MHEIYTFQAKSNQALEAAQVCWDLAQLSGDPQLQLQAYHALWGPYFYFYVGPHGLQSAVDCAQQGIALYRPEWHRAHVLRYGGHDPGVSICQETEAGVEQAFFLALLAETQLRAGQNETARQTIEDGLKVVRSTGEDYWQPELYRLYGNGLLADGHVNDAQSSFQRALKIAQQQRTKSLELRATTSLCQLWQAQGRHAEAHVCCSKT